MADRNRRRNFSHAGESSNRRLRLGSRPGERRIGSRKGDGGSEILRGGADLNSQILQRPGALLPLVPGFENHVILVRLRENRGYLALPERIVECVVDVLRSDAKTAGGVAVDIDQK